MVNENESIAVIVFVNKKVTAMYEILCHHNTWSDISDQT